MGKKEGNELAFMALATIGLIGVFMEDILLVAVPISLIIILGNFIRDEGDLFKIIGGREKLEEIISFAIALIFLVILVSFGGLSVDIYVISVLLVGHRYIIEKIVELNEFPPMVRVTSFVIGAWFLGIISQIILMMNGIEIETSRAILFTFIGGLTVALLRDGSMKVGRVGSVIYISLLLWLLGNTEITYLGIDPLKLVIIIGSIGILGYFTWKINVATVTGILMGLIFSLVVVIFGGYEWFLVIVVFFGGGSLVSRIGYEKKKERNSGQENNGLREAKNVLANGLVAVLCVLGFAMGPEFIVPREMFVFAFGGAVSAAMADTISSEIGLLFKSPRLITTFKKVEYGTDGGVTLHGTFSGILGAILIAIAMEVCIGIGILGMVVIVLGGFLGMMMDSLLGAMFEDRFLSNEGVNFISTLTGAICGIYGAIWFGLIM